MNIAQTSHHYYPHSGGTETVVKTLVDSLASSDNSVHVYSDYEDLKNLENGNNITYHGVKLKRIGKFRFPESGYWKDLISSEYDIVHVQGQRVWSSDYLYTHLNKIKGGKVFTAHGYYQLIYGGLANKIYYGKFMPSFLKKFDRIICLTEDERKISQRLFPKLIEKLTVLPNPVDFDKIDSYNIDNSVLEKHNLENRNFMIHAGGLQRNKNIEFILEAVKGTGYPLLLCGNIPDKAYINIIEKRAKELKIDLRVLGSIEGKELFSLIKNAKFYLSGSIFEGFGVSMVESSYLGTMVIAKRAGIASELQGMGGLKIADTPEQMHQLIQSELKIEEPDKLMNTLRAQFSKDKIVYNIKELYEAIK